MSNTLIAVDNSGSYRLYLTITTDMVAEAQRIHGCSPLAAAGLGRTLTAAGMMGLMLKGDGDRLTVQFKGDGPAKEILACANAKGEVKGYISDPCVDLPLKSNGKLDVGGSLGNGSLTVIRDIGLKEPYVGKIELVSGEIAEDLTQYFAVSEQQPSSVALGVMVDEYGKVCAAGGMIVQVLPGANDECLNALEDTLFFMNSMTVNVMDSMNVDDMMNRIFGSMPEEFKPHILDHRDISWHCDCSRERMEKALISVGKTDLAKIIEEDGKAELTCSFCRNSFSFNKEELTQILVQARS